MSSSSTQLRNVWDAEKVITIVYRGVMIVASIALVWKKYRRPRRVNDEERDVDSRPETNTKKTTEREEGSSSSRTGGRGGVLTEICTGDVVDIADEALVTELDIGLSNTPP